MPDEINIKEWNKDQLVKYAKDLETKVTFLENQNEYILNLSKIKDKDLQKALQQSRIKAQEIIENLDGHHKTQLMLLNEQVNPNFNVKNIMRLIVEYLGGFFEEIENHKVSDSDYLDIIEEILNETIEGIGCPFLSCNQDGDPCCEINEDYCEELERFYSCEAFRKNTKNLELKDSCQKLEGMIKTLLKEDKEKKTKNLSLLPKTFICISCKYVFTKVLEKGESPACPKCHSEELSWISLKGNEMMSQIQTELRYLYFELRHDLSARSPSLTIEEISKKAQEIIMLALKELQKHDRMEVNHD